MTGTIRVGVGGWSYEPWKGAFYPPKWPAKRELEYASRKLTTIEINGTFYRTQSADTFRKWAAETPDDFVFAVKGPRYTVNRRVLAEAGESIGWFLNSGPTEMGDKLGPMLWQFAATKQFDAEDFGAFLKLLPKEHAGVRLRHVVEPRHPSFQTEAFVDLVRQAEVAVVYADSEDYPGIADLSADFVYARLQRSGEDIETGYADADLDAWAARAKRWAEGGEPADLPHFGRDTAPERPRDVFVYFIAGAKVHDPAAAQALIARL